MKSVTLAVVAIFAGLASVAAKSVYEPRIVNGEDAKDGQFPYVASLRNRVMKHHFCGASILSARFLLTAAHCCTGSNASPDNVYAVVGAVRQSNGGVVVKVDKITPHNGFELDGVHNDIGLIRTAEEIIFTDYVQPIALPKENLSEDTVAVVLSGWGRHKFPSYATPDVLQYYEIETINNIKCAKSFPPNLPLREWVRDDNVCTINNKNGGACHGDSGSGLVDLSDSNHKTVIGIASWVYPCAQGYPDVYTRVFSHLDWIQNQIEEQSTDL